MEGYVGLVDIMRFGCFQEDMCLLSWHMDPIGRQITHKKQLDAKNEQRTRRQHNKVKNCEERRPDVIK